MNKPKILAYAFIFLVIVTMIVDVMDFATVTTGLETGVMNSTLDGVSLSSLITTFWQLATFKLVGLPVFINLLVFYPLTLLVVGILLEYLISLLPW